MDRRGFFRSLGGFLGGLFVASKAKGRYFDPKKAEPLGRKFFGEFYWQRGSGRVLEWAIWNVVLTSEQINQLASGVSPLAIQPEPIVYVAPVQVTMVLLSPHTAEIANQFNEINWPSHCFWATKNQSVTVYLNGTYAHSEVERKVRAAQLLSQHMNWSYT